MTYNHTEAIDAIRRTMKDERYDDALDLIDDIEKILENTKP